MKKNINFDKKHNRYKVKIKFMGIVYISCEFKTERQAELAFDAIIKHFDLPFSLYCPWCVDPKAQLESELNRKLIFTDHTLRFQTSNEIMEHPSNIITLTNYYKTGQYAPEIINNHNHGKRWSPEEYNHVCRRLDDGASIEQISLELKRTVKAIIGQIYFIKKYWR